MRGDEEPRYALLVLDVETWVPGTALPTSTIATSYTRGANCEHVLLERNRANVSKHTVTHAVW
jgi:hypothetical protein